MVNIHSIVLSELTLACDEACAQLSLSEQQAAAQLVHDDRRSAYIKSHYLLRRLLADAIGCDMQAIEYQYSTHGKPEVVGQSIHFNLSHSADMAVVAISREGPVGVDVECCRPRDTLLKLARRFFAKPEVAYIESASDQLTAFYQVWTAKEAYLKAQGLGISSGLQCFSVVDGGCFLPALDGLYIHSIDVGAGYIAMLVTEGVQELVISHD